MRATKTIRGTEDTVLRELNGFGLEGGGDRDVEELYIGSKEKFSRSDLARSNDK